MFIYVGFTVHRRWSDGRVT